ncbi:hypothetical protein [Brevibacillus agri]|uniref:hypothetical protein n=1 Tax=Brevibacillus agri TaxID=51101 RepID=UPI0012DEBD1F|nr:hypothetical protein [Brevibacillus agri]
MAGTSGEKGTTKNLTMGDQVFFHFDDVESVRDEKEHACRHRFCIGWRTYNLFASHRVKPGQNYKVDLGWKKLNDSASA